MCDDDVEKARMVAQHFGIGRAVADYETLLRNEELDAVIIATPNHLHAPMAQAALGYGKHVLCEKPPARNAAEASQIADAAKRSGKVLMYAMNNRFRGDVQVLRGYLERQELGKIFYAKTSWLRRRSRCGPGWYENKRSPAAACSWTSASRCSTSRSGSRESAGRLGDREQVRDRSEEGCRTRSPRSARGGASLHRGELGPPLEKAFRT